MVKFSLFQATYILKLGYFSALAPHICWFYTNFGGMCSLLFVETATLNNAKTTCLSTCSPPRQITEKFTMAANVLNSMVVNAYFFVGHPTVMKKTHTWIITVNSNSFLYTGWFYALTHPIHKTSCHWQLLST